MNRARTPAIVLFVAASTLGLTGCRAIGDIFKAGVGVGVFMVVGVVILVGVIAAMVSKR